MSHILVYECHIRRSSEVAALGRRIKLLGALCEFGSRRRNATAKAVSDLVKAAVGSDHAATVKATIITNAPSAMIEFEVVSHVATPHRNGTNGNGHSTRKATPQNSYTGIDEVESPSYGTTILRQFVDAGVVTPTSNEVAVWQTLLEEKTPEDAVASLRKAGLLSGVPGKRRTISDELGSDATHVETRSLLSLVAKGTDNFVAMLDGSGAIVWVNEAFSRITGYSQNEVSGQQLDGLLAGHDTEEQVINDFREALRYGYTVSEDIELYRQDGNSFWAHFTLTPVHDEHQGVTRWIVIGIDITRQRQTLEALSAAKDSAEASSRAKSEFLTNMSHEIRTPLNAILGMTDLCLGTQLSGEQLDYLKTVRTSAGSLLDLLNDLLDISRIEAGKLTIEKVGFDLRELLEETVEALRVHVDEDRVELRSGIANEVPQRVTGDPVRLRQILVNLVGNAIKFTSDGSIRVHVEPQWQTDGEVALHFSIADTGVGIPPEKLERIFDAFEQADATTTRQFGGTGLGLAITSQLLNLMGGRIWVNSQVGTGSTFHFSLRFNVTDPTPTESQKPSPTRLSELDPPQRLLRVLVADDHEANRTVAMSVLKRRGHTCEPASDGNQAVDLAASHRFDVILMDIQMPECDGYEATRKIRSSTTPHSKTPIIALTAHAMKGDREKCLQAGMDDYIAKPLDALKLIAVVEGLAIESEANPDKTATKNVNFDAALRRMAGDVDLLRGQMESFLVDGPDLVDQLSSSFETNNTRQAAISAHRLKSLFAAFDRSDAAALAQTVEQAARDEELNRYQSARVDLDGEMRELASAIQVWLRRASS